MEVQLPAGRNTRFWKKLLGFDVFFRFLKFLKVLLDFSVRIRPTYLSVISLSINYNKSDKS